MFHSLVINIAPIYLSLCFSCVCVCVCVRERETGRQLRSLFFGTLAIFWYVMSISLAQFQAPPSPKFVSFLTSSISETYSFFSSFLFHSALGKGMRKTVTYFSYIPPLLPTCSTVPTDILTGWERCIYSWPLL